MIIQISSAFDSGNILVKDASDASNVRLEIRKDNESDFYQWFYFRVTGERGQDVRLIIENAGGAAYPRGWDNYNAVVSYDLMEWVRVPTSYDGSALSIETKLLRDSAYVAYFAPYPSDRHAQLVAGAQGSGAARLSVLGQTLDGRDLDLLTIGEPAEGKPNLWITARQHPGETMAEWWMEGFLERLLDLTDEMAMKLREQTVLHIVPNMNPDGSARGHLRTNAAGVNLNREWQTPSMEKSPEVFLVLEEMQKAGVDFALDVHGDEAMPYNFIAGTEGIPSWTEKQAALLTGFKHAYVSASGGEFQTKYGYPVNKPGNANLSICSNAIAERFDCLAMTLEMPFKDNADLPDERHGWSTPRTKRLGANVIEAILTVLPDLR